MTEDQNKLRFGIYKIANRSNYDMLISHLSGQEFIIQTMQVDSLNGFTIELFYRKKLTSPKWKKFFADIVRNDQGIIQRLDNWNESFVCLLKNDQVLYAFTGGIGYFAIQDYINENFGIDILSRIISRDDKIIKSVKEKGVIGSILGESKNFRANYNLYENDNFGKIYQELKANLDRRLLVEKLGFEEEDIRANTICIVKSSFTISKAITLQQLIRLIQGCEDVLLLEPSIVINNMERIDSNLNIELVSRLQERLEEQLWSRFNSQNNSFMFDLCHKDIEKYLTASIYKVFKNYSNKNLIEEDCMQMDNIDILYQGIRGTANITQKPQFIELIKQLRIVSYDDDGNKVTSGQLIVHLLGDIEYESRHYFLIDGSWYRINNDFISSLNENCNTFINDNWLANIIKEWGQDWNEDEFNKQHIGSPNTIVLHKITPENIEPCDILKWDENDVYFIHVKEGFGNTMRDLCSQVIISARRIKQDFISDSSYIHNIYNTLQRKIGGDNYSDAIGRQTEVYNLQEFVSVFSKNHVFVVAILDKENADRSLKNIIQFRSNIAKFSLQSLIQSMKGLGIDLKVTQISRAIRGNTN